MNVPQSMNKKKIIRGIVMTLLINGALPLAVYQILLGYTSSFVALSIAAAIPLVDNLFSLIRYRRLDVFASFMLLGFILSLAAVFMGGNEQLILLRESFVTGALGLLFFCSFLFPRPLIYYFALRFTVGNDPQRVAEFAAKWQHAHFRFVLRIMTLVWGVALVGEAAVRSYLVYHLSITQFLAVSNFVVYGFIGAAILFTVYFRRYALKRIAK
ncbi:UNVERIFIED_CONTAM: intracellular septation protein A [Brevibacillus sp. OAP136]